MLELIYSTGVEPLTITDILDTVVNKRNIPIFVKFTSDYCSFFKKCYLERIYILGLVN